MSTTIQQSPAVGTMHSAYRPLVIRSSSSDPTTPKFRYLYRLLDADDNVVVTLRVPPNAAGQGIMDFSRVVRSYLHGPLRADVGTYGTPAPLLTDAVATAAAGAEPARLFQWEAGYQEAATAADAPVEYWEHGPTTFTASIFVGDDMASSTAPALGGVPLAGYRPQGTTAPGWLTEYPAKTTITTNLPGVGSPREIATTAGSHSAHMFHRGTNTAAGYDCGAAVDGVRVAWRSIATGTWTAVLVDVATLLGVDADAVDTSAGMSCIMATGPANLQAAGIAGLSGAFAAGDVEMYEMVLVSAAMAPLSAVLRFVVQDADCYNGTPVRVVWVNRAGGLDYYDFRKRRVRTLKGTRKTYERDGGTWNRAVAFEGWLQGDAGPTTYSLTARVEYTLETAYLTDADAVLLESLHMAPAVFVQLEHHGEQVLARALVDDSTYTTQTTKYDRLFQHTVTLTLSPHYTAE